MSRWTWQTFYINIINTELDLEGGDAFGGVKGGVLIISSRWLMRCSLALKGELSLDAGGWCYKSNLSSNNKLTSVLILWDRIEITDQLLVLLPVANFFRHTGADRFKGAAELVLRDTGNKKGQYQRVGAFEIGVDFERYPNIENSNLGYELYHSPTKGDYKSVAVDENGVKWYTLEII